MECTLIPVNRVVIGRSIIFIHHDGLLKEDNITNPELLWSVDEDKLGKQIPISPKKRKQLSEKVESPRPRLLAVARKSELVSQSEGACLCAWSTINSSDGSRSGSVEDAQNPTSNTSILTGTIWRSDIGDASGSGENR